MHVKFKIVHFLNCVLIVSKYHDLSLCILLNFDYTFLITGIFQVSTLIMDSDSTTLSRVKASVDSTICKRSDSNHIKKSFISALFQLGTIHKQLKNHKLRNHVERCFMFCLHQNQDNPGQLRSALEAIVPHLYGNQASLSHRNCIFLFIKTVLMHVFI